MIHNDSLDSSPEASLFSFMNTPRIHMEQSMIVEQAHYADNDSHLSDRSITTVSSSSSRSSSLTRSTVTVGDGDGVHMNSFGSTHGFDSQLNSHLNLVIPRDQQEMMDWSKIELAEQERKIQELVDLLHEREIFISETETRRIELSKELHVAHEKNKRLTQELDNARKTLASEKEQFADLLQELELGKNEHERTCQELRIQLEESEARCDQLKSQVDHLTTMKVNSDKKSKRLKSDLKKMEDTNQLKEKDYEWYGQQIMAIEADRDMYYQQVCALQEELGTIHQEFHECLKQKDHAISEIQRRMGVAHMAVSRATQTFANTSSTQSPFSGTTLERLKFELEQLEKENKLIIKKLDYGLNNLKNRMDSARNSSINRSLLFANSIMNDSATMPRSPLANQSSHAVHHHNAHMNDHYGHTPKAGDLSTSFEEFVTSKVSHNNHTYPLNSATQEVKPKPVKRAKPSTRKAKEFVIYMDDDLTEQPMQAIPSTHTAVAPTKQKTIGFIAPSTGSKPVLKEAKKPSLIRVPLSTISVSQSLKSTTFVPNTSVY